MTEKLSPMEQGMLRALQQRPDGSAPSKEEQQRALGLLARLLEPAAISDAAVVKAALALNDSAVIAEMRADEQLRRRKQTREAARAERGEREESPAKPIALRIGSEIMRGKTRGLYLSDLACKIGEGWRSKRHPCPPETTLRRWIAQWKADRTLPNSDLIWVQPRSRKTLAT